MNSRHHRIEQAEAKAESLRREIMLKYQAHSPNLSMEDIEALRRARADLAQAKALWSDWDGLLVPYSEQGQYQAAGES